MIPVRINMKQKKPHSKVLKEIVISISQFITVHHKIKYMSRGKELIMFKNKCLFKNKQEKEIEIY